MTYEVRACPFCGAQAEYDGGWEGEGWTFNCEHEAYSADYGEVEPLTFTVDIPDVQQALAQAAPFLEQQRRQREEEEAERKQAEAERRAALTPQQREAEDRQREHMAQALRNLMPTASPLPLLVRTYLDGDASDSAARPH